MPVDADRFVVRPYAAGDETAILDLFARSFHATLTSPRWAWRYRENPAGREHISLAFEDGRLVGHYAGYPVVFRLDGADILAHQIGDTMTDRSIRHIGRGATSVLGRTALDFYERFCEGKVAFNYGFNVSNIQRFSLRFLRSDRVEPVAYRYRDLAADPVRPISRWERYARGYQLELVTETGAEWDELFERAAPAYRFLARRDAAYVRWRYLREPDERCFVVAIRKWRRLAGWIAFRIKGDRFRLGDALIDPGNEDAFDVLLRHVIPGYPVRAVEAWFPARPRWFEAVLTKSRLLPALEPQDLSLMCVPFGAPDATARMRESLYYTLGDSDLF